MALIDEINNKFSRYQINKFGGTTSNYSIYYYSEMKMAWCCHKSEKGIKRKIMRSWQFEAVKKPH